MELWCDGKYSMHITAFYTDFPFSLSNFIALFILGRNFLTYRTNKGDLESPPF